MNTNIEYVIPSGTLVSTRNVLTQLRMREHITKQELVFSCRTNSGDGGLLYYFQHGDWLIAVDANSVENRDPLAIEDRASVPAAPKMQTNWSEPSSSIFIAQSPFDYILGEQPGVTVHPRASCA